MRRKTKAKIGSITGGSIGCISSIIGTRILISVSGAVPGLNSAGIMTGLYTIGFGSSLCGVAIITVGSVLITTGVGYAGYRLAKKFCS